MARLAKMRNCRSEPMIYDVCVVGLGGIGSAIAAQCAARGLRAIGLEQFSRGHDLGSSSGRTRMIRTAYFEDPAYVPLVRRAYELWHALARDTGEEILRITGVLAVGRETSEIIAGARRAARDHGVAIESFTADEVKRRYAMLKLEKDEVGILEPGGGVLNPERATAAHLSMAERRGAVLRFNVRMIRWECSDEDRFEIVLDDGSIVSARFLILALGPWVSETLAGLGVPLRIERNVQVWFEPDGNDYAAGGFPAFLLDRERLAAPLYGFPDFGDGVKAAFHGSGELTDANGVDRTINFDRDVAPVAREMEAWMPGAAAKFVAAKVCLYSLTPDEHFIIDRHPEHAHLILCGGFSGHGFKFAPVVGEIAADLVSAGVTRHPVDFLSLRRFAVSDR
jgi:sarcosine oxidase